MKLLAALGLFAACRGSPVVHRAGDEWLEAIHVEGNHEVSEQTLIAGLALHRIEQSGRAPDPYLVALDADRIRGVYLRRGFLEVQVASRTEQRGEATILTYTVNEGPRSTTRFAISGLPPDVTEAQIRAQIDLVEGAGFEHGKLERAKPALLGVLQEAGYARAQLDLEVVADPAMRQVTIDLAYTPGPRCTFGAISISGAPELHEAVRARLKLATGERFSNTAIFATRNALYAMRRFSTVHVAADPGDGAVVGVTVAVAEAPPHEVKLGGGLGFDPVVFEVRARAGYQIVGWPFPLDTTTLDLRPGYAMFRDGSGFEPRIRAVARLERQDFLATDVRGSVEAGYNYLAVEAYTSYGPRLALGIATPLWADRVQLRAGWALEGIQFRDQSPLIDAALAHQLGIDHFERVGAFDQALIVDLRDNSIEPSSGGYAELRTAEGGAFAGGAYTYFQATPELRGYLPLGLLVLAARARAGAIFGDVPPTERYFSGGSTGQRGFAERRLSPFVTGDVNGSSRVVPYGGAALAETGAEVRFPIMPIKKMHLGGVVFLDGGDVTEKPGDLSLGRLSWAAGVGLRLMTVIGPARLDFGYRLNRTGPSDPDPSSRYAIHLSLGEAF